MVFFCEFMFGDGHSDAFDAFCRLKISKYGISRPIYHYLSSHRLSCPPDNASNHPLQGSNLCWVVFFSEFMFGNGHSDSFDAFCRLKISKYGISRPIYHHID